MKEKERDNWKKNSGALKETIKRLSLHKNTETKTEGLRETRNNDKKKQRIQWREIERKRRETKKKEKHEGN